jgi:amino acid transporter
MEKPQLIRGIGRWDLTAIAVNTIVGAGIFGLPSKAAALIGTYSLIALIACAVIIGFIVLCFAEVSSRFRDTGGMYLYAREAFGPVVGFEVGWLYWIVRVTTFAANANLLLAYLGFFYPPANQGWTRVALIAGILALLTLVNFAGIRQSVLLTNLFTVGKIVPLLVFAAVGMFFIQPANFTFGEIPGYTNFSAAVLLLLYAFVGFEAAVIPAGETRDPQKNMPFALLTALCVVTVLFIFILAVCTGTLPGLAASERPLADAAAQFLGAFGAAFITIGALISISGNLNSGFLTASRMPFAMAEQKELPRVLSVTHAKFKTPYVSVFLTAAVALVFAVQSSFISALTISTITRLIVYAAVCASLPVFRARKDAEPAGFKAPFGVAAAVLSLVLTVWLLTNVDYQKEGLTILVLAAVGLVIYFAYRIFSRTKPFTEDRSLDTE